MEEKILIKSVIAEKTKKKFSFVIRGLIALAIFFLVVCLIDIIRGYCTWWWFIVSGGLLLVAGIVALVYNIHKQCELIITEKNVRGKTLRGKEVVLPLYMVSAYSTSKCMSTISVATSSGLTKFTLIGNYNEIGNVLSGLINERQTNTATAQAATSAQSAPAPQSNSMDDLVKLKSLLDSGIITQEEFDAKKKQLLGL